MNNRASSPVICFGEILWDSLPEGMFPGGAPMNVAYHLKRLGLRPVPITAVGGDALGEKLRLSLAALGVETSFVTVVENKPTGLARVGFCDGSPIFEILGDVAWDYIELSSSALALAERADALIFGTLAQRGQHNRQQFLNLKHHSPDALKILDVNLRPPFDSTELVWALVPHADVIKLNHGELAYLLDRDVASNQVEAGAREFSTRAKCGTVCVTDGPQGAGLLRDGKWFWENAREIKVRDAVGAGDAFLAGLIEGVLARKSSPPEILSHACRLAEFVTTQSGATPRYTVNTSGGIVAE